MPGMFDDLVPAQAQAQPGQASGGPIVFDGGHGISVEVGGPQDVAPAPQAPPQQQSAAPQPPGTAAAPPTGGMFSDLVPGAQTASPQPTASDPISQITGFMANLNRGLGVGDELAAGAKTAGNVLTGKTAFGDIPQDFSQSMGQQRQLEGGFAAAHPDIAALARGTGMALPMVFTGGAAAPEVAAGKLSAIAKGATTGGLTAYGYGLTDQGTPLERLQAANKAILPGMTLGGAFGTLAPSASNINPNAATAADHALTGVDAIPALVGSNSMQRIGQLLKGIPVVGQPLAAAAERTAGQLDTGIQALASRRGTATDPLTSGQALQTGAQSAVDRYGATTADLYKPINELEANAAPIPVSHTQGAITDLFAKYPTIPDWLAKNAPQLMSIKNTLEGANGQLTFGELKAMRSDVGKLIDQHLTVGNIDQARLKTLYGAMSDDMMDGAGHLGGPQAQAALSRADTYNAAKSARISNVLDSVIQANSPEQAYSKTIAMAGSTARADLTKLGQLKRSLDPDAWGDFSGGVIQQMGRDADGHFSPDKFVTAYGKMSPEGRRTLFGEASPDLDAFARVAGEQKAAGKFYNHSNSGNHAIGAMLMIEPVEEAIRHLAGGDVGGAVSSVAVPALTGMAGNAAARLLASPGWGRTMLQAAASPAASTRLIESYAAQNPGVAALARQYGQRLQHGLAQGVAGVSASIPSQQSR